MVISKGVRIFNRGTGDSHDEASWGESEGEFWKEAARGVGPWGPARLLAGRTEKWEERREPQQMDGQPDSQAGSRLVVSSSLRPICDDRLVCLCPPPLSQNVSPRRPGTGFALFMVISLA